MTKENVLRLLKHYEASNKPAYEDLKAHVLVSRKFTQLEKDNLFGAKDAKKPKG